MIALTALFLIGLLFLAAFGIARIFVLDIKNEDTKFLINFILAIVVAFIPISPEVIGSIKFKRQCESMDPAKYFIPSNIERESLIDSQLDIKWRGNGEWNEIQDRIFGKEGELEQSEKEVSVSNFPFKVVSTHVTYTKNGLKIKEFNIYRSSGSWLNKFFGGWVQYQCFSPGWTSPENHTQLYFDKK